MQVTVRNLRIREVRNADDEPICVWLMDSCVLCSCVCVNSRALYQPNQIHKTRHDTTRHDAPTRQDVAKYLRNLDPNSAYYDPKTRAMRENPLPGANPEEVVYAGDNYLRCVCMGVRACAVVVVVVVTEDACACVWS